MTTRKRLALFLLCLASFMAVVDTTIVSIALPSMRRELGFTGADAGWILNGYALTFGGLVLLLGRAGDLYGRRRLFVAGLALFGAASLLGGFAWEPWILVFARFIQGVGAAALVPASLSLLTAIFAEGEERNRAIGIYGAMAALGFVVGMVGGGVITEYLGWRWVLFVNVPVALAALVPAPAALPESRNERAPRSLDLAGALTATSGLGLLIYAISEVPENGWTSIATLGFGTLGTLFMACFVVAERHSSAPLVPLGVLKKPAVVVPNAAIFLQSMVGIAWLYVLTLYLPGGAGAQRAYGRASVHPHDPRLRRCRSSGRTARDKARDKDDGIFGPRAGGRGAALDDTDVRRRGPALRALWHGDRGGRIHALQRASDDRW